MSVVLGILSCFAVVTVMGSGYWLWERKAASRKRTEGLPLSSTTPTIGEVRQVPTAVVTPQPPVEPAIAPASPALAPQPLIPDPWLSESDDAPEVPTIAQTAVAPSIAAPPGLKAAIAQAGQTGQLHQVAYLLRYTNHRDSEVRAESATALGKLAATHPGRAEHLIPVLGKLSRDPKPTVRLAAVEALGKIPSAQVIPLLQQAQKTATGEIGRAINTALQRHKTYPMKKPAKPSSQGAGKKS